jgi:hypothetical protein
MYSKLRGEQPSRLFWSAAVSAAVAGLVQVRCESIGLRTGETPRESKAPAAPEIPNLLEAMRAAIRMRGCSLRTEET